jgi:hypothetical protein
MVERIEKIAGIKGIGSGHAFERKEGYEDQAGRHAFAQVLKKAMSTSSVSRPTPAASLELSGRPTQSLFYGDGMDFSRLVDKFR